jgi:hypothetical protein
MDPKGNEIVIDEKEIVNNNEPKGEKAIDSGSNKNKDGKKRHIKKVVYYDNDTSSSSPKDEEEDSSSKKNIVKQNYSFDYSCIMYNSNAHLLFIPIGKPPHFDGKIFVEP